ncbi:MAG: hypothetical protein P8181_01260 [bacterium]
MKAFALVLAFVGWFGAVQSHSALAAEPYPDTREAFVLGLGLGWGNAGADLSIVEKVDRQNGVAGDLLLGWAARNNIVVGFEFDGWSQFFGDTRWVFNLSSVALTYYPSGGLFVTGGLGIGTSRVEINDSSGSNIRQDRAGVGYSLAGGYEWRILEEIAVAPKLKWAYLDINGDVTNYVDYLTVTIQLTWYMPGK